MSRRTFHIEPLAHMFDLSTAPYNANPLAAQWPSRNVRTFSRRIEKRWDYSLSRTLAAGAKIQYIPLYKRYDGTTSVMILTETDLCQYESADKFSYKTDTYTTGTITSITEDAVVGNGTAWDESGVAAGDKFIVDSDHDADGEDDANWAIIESVDTATGITLTDRYTGTGTGTYKIRKVYSVPTDERWAFAVVSDKFIFSNGNTNVQSYTGTGYAADLDATNAIKARYLTSYANRLVMADMYDGADRKPWRVMWSKEGDPTDWTAATSGANDFIDTEEPITGLGVVGRQLIVYKKTSFHIGNRTGVSTAPISFPDERRGVGLWAPYSLITAMGTNFWWARDDFYTMNGAVAEPIGEAIRHKFLKSVDESERVKTVGFSNRAFNEAIWLANTKTDGQLMFVFNYKENSWTTYDFNDVVTGFGG